MPKDREACGRCSMSVAVDVANLEHDDDDGRVERDPYGDDRIEVEETQLRTLSPDGWIAGVSSRIDDAVSRLTWGR
ncbi:hypothetical protein [Natronobacterium texcoconense]|uniref:Uncharacterized protein n=1 Tax=Natronobacterium texcoconense TaxID=1095778 RepID=A0A1H1FS73_NATTX|nr:hypothetical protein [Natronobacterium texcoconense]SDR03933.1 hypothetical protein SAMN04489842_2098 [Natronobacterium texcoconense]